MSEICLRLYLIPSLLWEAKPNGNVSLATLAEEALTSERRLAKPVAPARELSRYFQFCGRMESLARELIMDPTCWRDLSVRDGAAYQESVIEAFNNGGFPEAARWGMSFYPPGNFIHAHLEALQSVESEALRWRREVFSEANKSGSAVVELALSPSTNPYHLEESINNAAHVLPVRKVSWAAQSPLTLREQISSALADGTPVNFSNFRHRTITEELRTQVFTPRDVAQLRVIFADGTEATPFPLPAFRSDQTDGKSHPALSIVLMSGRHPELDRQADMALIRNAEITANQSMREQESLAALRALSFLRSPALAEGGKVSVFHTGLEPVVVGFYRAVVMALEKRVQHRQPALLIVPLYQRPAEVIVNDKDNCLLQLIERYARALRLVEKPSKRGVRQVLRWLLDRPMTDLEREALIEAAPQLAPMISKLFHSSQYISGTAWGPVEEVGWRG